MCKGPEAVGCLVNSRKQCGWNGVREENGRRGGQRAARHRSYREPDHLIMDRTLAFTLSELGSHRRIVGREMTQ